MASKVKTTCRGVLVCHEGRRLFIKQVVLASQLGAITGQGTHNLSRANIFNDNCAENSNLVVLHVEMLVDKTDVDVILQVVRSDDAAETITRGYKALAEYVGLANEWEVVVFDGGQHDVEE